MSDLPLSLVLTVGGSPEPLARAIEAARSDRVIFVVSEDAPGVRGSRPMVEAPEIIWNPRSGERGPGLAHLPATPADRRVIEVPADDLDLALARIDAAVAAELAAGRRVICDYTGGTKTMTAALVLAGSAHEGVRLQFMAGQRTDLVKVASGSEHPVEMPKDLIGLGQLFTSAKGLMASYQYGAALGLIRRADRRLEDLGKRVPKPWKRRIDSWKKSLEVLEYWDRFDHGEAWRTLSSGLDREEKWALAFEDNGLAERLETLAENARKPHPVLLEDLWLNAQRRAAKGLYDDAIARLYRLAEAAVQTHLWMRFRIETGHVPPNKLPEHIRHGLQISHDKKIGKPHYKLPLSKARDLLEYLDPENPVAREHKRKSPDWQQQRNQSILAHGFQPLKEENWKKAEAWFRQRRKIFWEDQLGRPTLQQLPKEWF